MSNLQTTTTPGKDLLFLLKAAFYLVCLLLLVFLGIFTLPHVVSVAAM